MDGIARDGALAQQVARGVDQGHVGAGDGGGARAAVGLDDVAVQVDGALAEGLEVDHRAQGAPDEALDLHGAPALAAARGLARHALGGRARQHAVLGRDPALPGAAQEARHLLEHARVAQHARVAELDQHRALGMLGVAARDADGPQLVGGASARSHRSLLGASGRASIAEAASALSPRRARARPAPRAGCAPRARARRPPLRPNPPRPRRRSPPRTSRRPAPGRASAGPRP